MKGFVFIEILISSIIIVSLLIFLGMTQIKINHTINSTWLKLQSLIDEDNKFDLNYSSAKHVIL